MPYSMFRWISLENAFFQIESDFSIRSPEKKIKARCISTYEFD